MNRLSSRFGWLIVIVAVVLAAAARLWGDVGAWVWVPVGIAFLAIGALLGGDGDSDGGDDSPDGDSSDSGGHGHGGSAADGGSGGDSGGGDSSGGGGD